ncbi:MAG: hemolysin family protein [Brevinemataceae bacterium]
MMEWMSYPNWELAAYYFSCAFINFLLSGFLGGSETSFLSINRIILYAKNEKQDLSAKILVFLTEHSSKFLTSIVILNNVTLILSTLFVSKMLSEAFHVSLIWIPVWTTLIMTPCSLLLAEILPKALGHSFTDKLSYRFAYIWIVIFFIMFPIAWIFRLVTNLFSRIFGLHGPLEHGFAKREFQELLDISLRSGALNAGEREFINNILEFRDIRASEAMTPLSQLICIEKKQTVYKALELMQNYSISILPVYDSRIDNPIGRIRAKDLIAAESHESIESYIQEAFFVPETAYLEKILVQMQKHNLPLAFVADEYGGIVGVLRIEDIVTEIVGEVMEEGEIDFKMEIDGSVSANGLCDINDLLDVLNLEFESVEAKTVGGFIMEKLGRMPNQGDIVYQKPWYFEVMSLEGRRIHTISIKKNISKNYLKKQNIDNNESSGSLHGIQR